MSEPIFEQKETKVEVASDTMLSFKDCPNKCIDGYYVDPYKHKRVKCMYCADKRKKAVRESLTVSGTQESVADLLNFPRSFVGYSEFNIESVIPTSARKFMVEESVQKVTEQLKELLQKVSVGEVSPNSLLLNFGSRSFDENFVFSYLFRAYEAGLTVAPYTSAYDLHLLRLDSESGVVEARKKYDTLLKSEVCILVIDAGATKVTILGVKGLMQMRAYKNLSTIIITHSWCKEVHSMQCDDEDISSKNLARLISIEYNEKFTANEAKYQDSQPNAKVVNNRAGISSADFANLTRPSQSL